jgi:hypothetical protein
MKQYRLKKEIKYMEKNSIKLWKVGTILDTKGITNEIYFPPDGQHHPFWLNGNLYSVFWRELVLNNPDWFEEVKEEKKLYEALREFYKALEKSQDPNDELHLKMVNEKLKDKETPFENCLRTTYLLTDTEKNIIDAYRRAKDMGLNANHIMVTTHGVIITENNGMVITGGTITTNKP